MKKTHKGVPKHEAMRRDNRCNDGKGIYAYIYLFIIYLFIYTYNDILSNVEAINVEVMVRMLKILWKETERKRVVEN